MTLEREDGKNLLQQEYVSDKIGKPITAEDLAIKIEEKRAKEAKEQQS